MRRTRRPPLAALALLLLLALVAGACGGDDDDDGSSDSGDEQSDGTGSDDTEPDDRESDDTGTDDTKSDDTDDTDPDDDPAEASMAAAEQLVRSLGLPLTSAQEACLGEELVAEFDSDELETLQSEQDLSDDLAERASDVLDLCLPLDDVVYLAAIEQGLAPADADCVAEQIADLYTWADFISGDETILDSFTEAGLACAPSGSTISLPSIPQPTTTLPPVATTTTPATGGAAAPGTQVSFFDSEAGECWNDAEFDQDAQVYTVVDCAQSHDQEIMAVFLLPDGAFPGTDQVRQAGDDGCVERFPGYVGTDYASSVYYVGAVTPTQETWDDPVLRDREVVCVLYVPAGDALTPTTGSAAGSGR